MKNERGIGKKLLELLNSKPVIGVLIFIMFSLASVFAADVIVQDGSLAVESDFNVSNVLFVNVTSGNVGIGTTGPVADLDISNPSGNTALRISIADANDWIINNTNGVLQIQRPGSPKVTFLDSGNVGIGTTSPRGLLHINSSTTNEGIGTLIVGGLEDQFIDNPYLFLNPIFIDNFNGDVTGWTTSSVTFTATANGTAIYDATAGDPSITTPTLSINGSENRIIAFKYRTLNTGTTDPITLQIFYSAAHGGSSESFSKAGVDLIADGNWHVVTLDMTAQTGGSNDWVTSTVTSIRLDFGGVAIDDFEFDWIAIGQPGPGFQRTDTDLYVDGRVGIGTTSPAGDLEVSDSSDSGGSASLVIDADSDKTATLYFYSAGAIKTAIYRPISSIDLVVWSLAVGNIMIFDQANGAVTKPKQPCFYAFNSVTDSDVTGAGTVVTIDFNSEVFDQGSDFSADTFTAPITGRYLLTAQIRAKDITSVADSFNMRIITSNRNIFHLTTDADNLPTVMTEDITVVADMDSGDTAFVSLVVSGIATNVVDIVGDTSSVVTFFSGCLLA